MPVNINEFEVVVDTPPASSSSSGSNESATPASPRGATPHEVENMLRREHERSLRVQAH